ncbi:DegT/DnrJ/EryC1/StrS family aminotransferase [Chloroflexota bacterium]
MIKVSRGCLGEEELAGVKEALDYGYFGLSYKVFEFEEELGKYLGTKHVVATNTGTSALHLALDALAIGDGDEVIVPSLTFVGSFQAISAVRATPVPCDIYPDTLLADIDDIRGKITKKTKAIMPVHYAGNLCNMDALMKISEENGIRIVEDAAHAFGSYYHGRRIGSFGDITCFSFDSIKNITCGEGGAIICQDSEVADILRQRRLVGIDRKSHTSVWKERSWFYQIRSQGFRYHMSNINAAIGLAQLRKVDSFIARRQEICRRYDSVFKGIPAISCLKINYDEVAPHVYVIRVKDGRRDDLMDYLKSLDIETGINYIPNHLHPFYANTAVNLPETEKAYEEILTLPLHFGLSDDDVTKVIQGVIEGLK